MYQILNPSLSQSFEKNHLQKCFLRWDQHVCFGSTPGVRRSPVVLGQSCWVSGQASNLSAGKIIERGLVLALHMQRIAPSAQTSHRYHHHHHNHHHQHHHHHHHCHDDKPAKAGHQCLHLPADPLYPSSNAEKHPKSGKRGNVQKSSKIASNRTHNSVRSRVKARSWASCK